MPREFHQGRYSPTNPKKYEGDASNIVFRSSWEVRCMKMFDLHPYVIKWSSEEIVIPYFYEGDGKMHRYFPDFKVTMETSKGRKTYLVEVKPYAQTIEPVNTKRKRKKTFINEVMTYTKNQAKWKAAEEYCKDRLWEFMILTEKDIFNGKVW